MSKELLAQHLKNKNLQKHCFAVALSMKALAKHFNENEDKWETCGMLHDIDYEQASVEEHSKKGKGMLEQLGFEKDICDAVLTHNEAHGIKPESLMAKALFCIDPLTGLIVAATLVLPSKKISELTLESVLKRFKENAFARGANREIIAQCKELIGLELNEFTDIVLKAMKSISQDLEL